METLLPQTRTGRGRSTGFNTDGSEGGKRQARNKQWVAEHVVASTSVPPNNSDGERWERGSHRGGRTRGVIRGGRRFPNATLTRIQHPTHLEGQVQNVEHEGIAGLDNFMSDDPDPETPEEREKFYQELVKAREVERRRAISEGKMDDPLIPKRLEDAITMVGTCLEMCPRFERYRRERENNLHEWETIPGTKRVDHKRAVKMYERAAGDKTLPSDLRPPIVLKRTLDYLFHDLLPRGGFVQTWNFIRDRTRAVRNDFTMQHETGLLAMECHDRCARFHILALHFERNQPGFSVALEEQQLMNTLQSLKEFYEDQRERYQSPNELEMRVYHRLIHIRDQKERHEDIPVHISEHPVFKLTTKFRLHVQNKSAPIGKTTPLIVGEEGMGIFGELAAVLREQGSIVMIYLVACLLERLFGKEAIEDIDSIRGDLTIPELIDGNPIHEPPFHDHSPEHHYSELHDIATDDEEVIHTASPVPIKPAATEWLSSNFEARPTASAIFGQPSGNVSGPAPERSTPVSAFSSLTSSPNPFGPNATFGAPTVTTTAQRKSVFATVIEPPGTQIRTSPTPLTTDTLPSTSIRPEISQSINRVPDPSPSFAIPSTTSGGAPSFLPSSNTNTFELKPTTTQTAGNSPSQVLFSSDTTHPALNPKSQPFFPAISRHPTLSFTETGSQSFSSAPPRLSSTETHQTLISTPTLFPLAAPAADGNADIIVDSPQPVGATNLEASSSVGFKVDPLSSIAVSTVTPSHSSNGTSSLETATSRTPSSPLSQPPPLSKKRLVSLPSTPTSPLKLALSKSVLDVVRNQELISNSPELLSPLYLPSPSASPVRSFMSNGTPSAPTSDTPSGSSSSLPEVHGPPNGKVKRHPLDLDAMAIAFARKSLLVKNSFNHWLARTTDHAAWLEACEHSNANRSKIQLQQNSPKIVSDRKRTSSVLLQQSPLRRIRRRISSEYKPPRSDEELAQRFKENQEEHARRWAKESFLRVTREHVKMARGSNPENWMVWLSMNPENDGTAIWLECKFNVPASGQWESESVFSIPLSDSSPALPSSPGLIVFECTPLEGVTDDLERKFRLLDDCARLRNIIKSLPPRRYFIPCLLILSWTDGRPPDTESDLFTMIVNFVKDSVLGSYHILGITSVTTNLDEKYEEALKSLPLDTEGKLVQALTLPAVFQLFRNSWTPFSLEWVEKCNINGEFDWAFYAQVLEISIELLNDIAHMILNLVGADIDFDSFPYTDGIHNITDTESCYAVTMSWLEDSRYIDSEAASISKDLLSHLNMGHDFPTTTFLDHLSDLSRSRLESHFTTDKKTLFTISKNELMTTMQRFQRSMESHAVTLLQTYALHIRRSPKRRFASEETTTTTMSSSLSKRRKLSVSADPSVRGERSPTPPPIPIVPANENNPPSPTASTTSTMPSEIITINMLRALTKDIRKKYVSPQ